VAVPQPKMKADRASKMEKPASVGIFVRRQQISPDMSAFSMIPCRGCQLTQSHPKPPASHLQAIYLGGGCDPQATPMRPTCDPQATLKPPTCDPQATLKPPTCDPQATLKPLLLGACRQRPAACSGIFRRFSRLVRFSLYSKKRF
jgi:hypothetical protein